MCIRDSSNGYWKFTGTELQTLQIYYKPIVRFDVSCVTEKSYRVQKFYWQNSGSPKILIEPLKALGRLLFIGLLSSATVASFFGSLAKIGEEEKDSVLRSEGDQEEEESVVRRKLQKRARRNRPNSLEEEDDAGVNTKSWPPSFPESLRSSKLQDEELPQEVIREMASQKRKLRYCSEMASKIS
eukprot:TRINITY_DN2722_c0_g1_i2.p1 TRINITY_DN2722_c0_g1~~TRINITY_DN2722_c0_g1_i2.p1  ORF type:complete len:184 (-),score=34.29 TRINITY_DN2722_c0_g1_i2:254-805(-)